MAKKNRIALSSFDDIPEGMKKYLQHYGYHFSRKMVEDAIKHMYKKNPTTGKEEKIEPVTKEKVDEALKKYNIKIDNDVLYDSVYVWASAMADYFGKSLPNEQMVAMFVKDVLDDPDQSDGYVFNRFYADRCFSGEPIDWESMM